MGVLNVTPDSFSDGGSFLDPATAIEHGLRMAEDGADIIDVGGESTRPGSEGVPAEEELKRVLPVIEALAKKLAIPISVDTSKAEVARAAVKAGAAIVNDISGLGFDEAMGAVVAGSGAGLVLMHIQGKPRDMQKDPHYDNVVLEVADSLRESVERARAAGVEADRIAVDPGVGFGKTVAHNLAVLNNLATFKQLGFPLVVGASRKSFIGKLDREAPADQRLPGSIAAAVAAVAGGADVVRVHDVAETRQALAVARAIRGAGW